MPSLSRSSAGPEPNRASPILRSRSIRSGRPGEAVMNDNGRIALYARVSTESQARDHTIASQIAALRERIAADGHQIEPADVYVDEGYSGAILLRPALERLRDAAAAGHLACVYGHAPDRLARRYAHQVLLIEELRRAGVEVVFLNRPIGGTAEDDLLLQVQGVIAEYERAKILERGRRGRRHAAPLREPASGRRSGAFRGGGIGGAHRSTHLCLGRSGSTEPARSMPPSAADGLSDPARLDILACIHDPRHAGQSGLYRTRSLRTSTLLASSAAAATDPWASEALAAGELVRPQPREEWIEIPVPSIVDPAVFEATRVQLEESRKRKRERAR